jgi:hypothetical protein
MRLAMIMITAIALIGCDKQPVGRFQLFAGTYEVRYGGGKNNDPSASSEKQPGVFLLDTVALGIQDKDRDHAQTAATR